MLQGFFIFTELLMEVGQTLVRHLGIRILFNLEALLMKELNEIGQTDVELL